MAFRLVLAGPKSACGRDGRTMLLTSPIRARVITATNTIKNIWSEIKTIRENIIETHQLKENEEEKNDNQEIRTLQQIN